jgi:short-subunit dehydrogenase
MANQKDPLKQKKNALITGASSGIGYELSKLFARDNYNLVLVARNEGKLNQVADELTEKFGISVKIISKDLSLPTSAEEIFTTLQSESIQIDVLVNNAGYAVYGLFSETDPAVELGMIQTNIASLTYLTKLCLNEMLERGEGKILNVASTAAFQPGPLMAAYYATKAYVLSFSEAIANELRGVGVTVTALCPGPTETGFQNRAGMEGSKLIKGKKIMDAETAAKVGYRALMKGKTVVIPGLKNKILAWSVRFTPRNMVTQIVRGLQETGNQS